MLRTTTERELTSQSFSLNSKGFEPYTKRFSFSDIPLRDKPPKHLTLKTSGSYLEAHKTEGISGATLKGLCTWTDLPQGPAQKELIALD